MKKGWISFTEELPPIGLIVIISYPNVAYGGHFFSPLGKRIDDVNVIVGSTEKKLSVVQSDCLFTKPYANYWAYNIEQELPNICDCISCYNEKNNK